MLRGVPVKEQLSIGTPAFLFLHSLLILTFSPNDGNEGTELLSSHPNGFPNV